MSRRIVLALALLALSALACGVLVSEPAADVGPPPNTIPPIPTKLPLTPTPVPTGSPAEPSGAGGVAEEQPTQIVRASLIYGTARGGRIGLYLLSEDGQHIVPLNLGESIQHAVWPHVSPDGTQLAFVSIQSDFLPLGIFITDMNCVVTAEGCPNPPRQLTFGEGLHPKWSPDGSQIAYSCNNQTDVCVINADGSGRQVLTADEDAADLFPGWTRDGRIVFMSTRDVNTNQGRRSEIYIMNTDGTEVTRLTEDETAFNAYPSVSPDGKIITFESSTADSPKSEIYLMNTDGSNRTQITSDPAWNQIPVWTSDGARILFAGDFGEGNIDLHIVNSDGTNRISLTTDLGEDGGLRWGHAWLPIDVPLVDYLPENEPSLLVSPPRGSAEVTNAVIFASNAFNCPNCLENGIYIVGFDGANLTRLPVDGLYPTWAPDFTRFAFVQGGELYMANVDGSDVTQMTHAYHELGSLSWHPDGAFILADCAPYGQHDVCLIDAETGILRNLTEEITFGVGVPYPTWFGQRIVAGASVLDLTGQLVDSLPTPATASPDGTRLAFIDGEQLAVSDVNGENKVVLTNDGATKAFPVWSSDGGLIIYTAATGDGRLYLFAVRSGGGTQPYQLSPSPIALGPDNLDDPIEAYYGYSWGP